MLLLRCLKHPGYKGIKRPRLTCIPCQTLFDLRLSHPGLVFTPKKAKKGKKKDVLCY
jgi:hypothetical protein